MRFKIKLSKVLYFLKLFDKIIHLYDVRMYKTKNKTKQNTKANKN